jgi:lysozyme
MNKNVKINKFGLDIIKSYESLHDGNLKVIGLQPKLCPAGVWTEGYGRAMFGKDGKFLTRKNTTQEQAEKLATIKNKLQAEVALLEDTEEFSKKIKPFIKVEIDDNMFSALVSFAYNLGAGALQKSTLLKKLNSKDFIGASEEFKKWNKSGDKIMLGLTRRRESEKNLFLQGLKKLEINEITGD